MGVDGDDYRVRLGRLIRQARESHGWSQHELARRMDAGVTADSQVSRWERGVQMPNPDHFAELERVLGRQLIP